MAGKINTDKSGSLQSSPEALARKKRMDDAMHLRKPDRVPVAPAVVHYYATKAAGISNKDAMYKPKEYYKILKEATIRYDWDAAIPPGSLLPVEPLEILGMKQVKWPGKHLPENQPWQWVEGEYMMQDEYDEMLADPNGFSVKKIWPRISVTLAPLGCIFQNPPPLIALSNAYALPGVIGDIVSLPEMIALLKKTLALAEAHKRNNDLVDAYIEEMTNLGYTFPTLCATYPPFDWISDVLRGLRGIMLDMFQVPDKLLAAIEMFTPLVVEGAIMMARQKNTNGVFIPMHRGAGGFMSNEQYARFYWPGLKALFLGLIDAGLTPVPLFEGDYTPRLEFLQELPPKKIVGHFDKVDRKKAKKLLGDIMCFWGNVPASLMCFGTPREVEDDVKALIDLFGDNGGLIIDSTMGLPDESRQENVLALTNAVNEFGVY
jgi:uroporphyrinogen-III decarboxylase